MKATKVVLVVLALALLPAAHAQSRGAQDWGDAPDPPYPTVSASSGAQHGLSQIVLGVTIDDELDGFPTAAADGDDVNNTDDEDGVVFTSPIDPGLTANVDVTVSGGSGLLDAWIDFGDNGNWTDPGDQIFASQPVVAGVNSLTFAVPATTVPNGLVYARFRLSSSGGLTPTGQTFDGEVEDYRVGTVPVELQSFTIE